MAVSLRERLGRLFAADAHGVLESLEDRDLLLAQHLREAELELARRRARHEELAGEARSVAQALPAERDQAAALDEDARLALEGGREDLARFALRRWLAARRRLEALERREAAVDEERTRLGETLAGQERRLETLRERVREARRRAAAPARPDPCGEEVADAEVELELLRRRGGAGGPR